MHKEHPYCRPNDGEIAVWHITVVLAEGLASRLVSSIAKCTKDD